MKFHDILPSLTPQAAILGLTNEADNIYNLNHILLISKHSGEKHMLNIDILIDNLATKKTKIYRSIYYR